MHVDTRFFTEVLHALSLVCDAMKSERVCVPVACERDGVYVHAHVLAKCNSCRMGGNGRE